MLETIHSFIKTKFSCDIIEWQYGTCVLGLNSQLFALDTWVFSKFENILDLIRGPHESNVARMDTVFPVIVGGNAGFVTGNVRGTLKLWFSREHRSSEIRKNWFSREHQS